MTLIVKIALHFNSAISKDTGSVFNKVTATAHAVQLLSYETAL